MKAFILCAGLGKRLYPISKEIPKPLIPFFGKTPLLLILEKLKELKIKEIGINLHWKAEKIKKYLSEQKYFDFHFFYEKELLDTGGALKNAEDFLKNSNFIVINSDIIFYFSLKDAIKYHNQNKNLCTILITDNSKSNNLIISKKNKLNGISEKISNKYKTFTGIGIYKPEVLKYMKGKIFSIKETWLELIKDNLIDTYYVEPEKWYDLGSIKSYIKTIFNYLKKEGEKNYIFSDLDLNKIELEGFNFIEKNVKILKKIKLKNCIVFPNAKLRKSEKNKIIGKTFKLSFSSKIINSKKFINDQFCCKFTQKKKTMITPLNVGGSIRNFYFFKKNGKKYIYLISSFEDKEFERWFKIRKLLNKIKFPVPSVFDVSFKSKKAIIEFCGEYSLYDYSKFSEKSKLEILYKKIIDKVVLLHKKKLDNYLKNNIFKDYVFSKDYFLWETRYFYENFLKGYKKIDLPYEYFENVFEKLAEISSKFEKRILHRDLQSQNILISKNNQIKFIDFQSARLGPPGYDIASLLWDPYINLTDDLRSNLLNYYKEKMSKSLPADFDESLKYLKAQRHFQAIGAYSFLGLKRGKKHFLKFIKPAIKFLKEDLKNFNLDFFNF